MEHMSGFILLLSICLNDIIYCVYLCLWRLFSPELPPQLLMYLETFASGFGTGCGVERRTVSVCTRRAAATLSRPLLSGATKAIDGYRREWLCLASLLPGLVSHLGYVKKLVLKMYFVPEVPPSFCWYIMGLFLWRLCTLAYELDRAWRLGLILFM